MKLVTLALRPRKCADPVKHRICIILWEGHNEYVLLALGEPFMILRKSSESLISGDDDVAGFKPLWELWVTDDATR